MNFKGQTLKEKCIPLGTVRSTRCYFRHQKILSRNAHPLKVIFFYLKKNY